MVVCCSLRDTPCGEHGLFAVELLRETGKNLASDLGPSLAILEGIYSQHGPVCPSQLSLKRTCLMFVQLLQVIDTSEVLLTKVGILLGTQIGRMDAKLLRVLLHESLDVVRILRDLVGTGTVEVFQNFRSMLTTTNDGRGIVITTTSPRAMSNLLAIVLGIDEQFGCVFLADQKAKLESIVGPLDAVSEDPQNTNKEHIWTILKREANVGLRDKISLTRLMQAITQEDPNRGILSFLKTGIGSLPIAFGGDISKKIAHYVFLGDIAKLRNLATNVSVDELFVANLNYPMLLVLLEKAENSGSRIIKFIASECVCDFNLVEFIEASFSHVTLTLISELAKFDHSGDQFNACVTVGRQVVTIAEQIAAPAKPVSKKARKTVTNVGILGENYLEIIQEIQDKLDSVGLTFLIALAGKDIVAAFASRTLETVLTLSKNEKNEKLVSVFLSTLEQINFLAALPGLLAYMDVPTRSHWLGQKGVPEGLKSLWNSSQVEEESLVEYTVNSLRSEIFSKSVKVEILSQFAKHTVHKDCSELLSLVLEFARLNLLEEDLVVCGKVFGKIGTVFVPQKTVLKKSTDFVEELVVRFLIPNLRSNAHAFALQQVLSVTGNFSDTYELVLRPYLTSSYRQTGSAVFSGAVSDLNGLLGWLTERIPDEKMALVFRSLQLAANENLGLAAWLVPYAAEMASKNGKILENLGEILSSLLRTESRVVSSTVFALMDRIAWGGSAIPLPLLVNGAMLIEDWARALFWEEKREFDFSEEQILSLCKIYKGLEDASGVAGVLTENFGKIISTNAIQIERFAIAGKYADWVKFAQRKCGIKARLEALMNAGEYLAIVEAVQSSSVAGLEEWGWEACWKGGHKCAYTGSSFNAIMYRMLSLKEKVEKWEIDKVLATLMHQVAINATNSGVNKLCLLSMITEQTKPPLDELPGEVLVGAIALARSQDNLALVEELSEKLVRHYRKVGDVARVRQMTLGREGTSLEWLKAIWSLGYREEARLKLDRIENLSLNGKLLLVRWSTELERLIPRVTISKYRDLIKQASSENVELREKVHFHFADFLDSVNASSAWNMQNLAREICVNLFESIKFDSSGKRTLYTVNRLLQLHFEYSRAAAATDQTSLAAEVVKVLATGWKLVPVWIWAQALPQLIPRLTGETADFANVIEQIVSTVLCTYPRQSGWSLIQLLTSRNSDRKKVGTRIFNSVAAKAEYPNMGQLLTLIKTVGESLVAVARFDGGMKSLSESKEGSRLLRDTGGLLVMPIRTQLGSLQNNVEIRIDKFADPVYVYNTKAKPKRISVTDTNGKSFCFILKMEKKTDLRKDARMMDFVSVVNHEISSRSSLMTPLRTYSVLPLSEDCALIEYIPNLITLRKIIDESLAKTGKNVNMYLNKEVMNKLSNKAEGFGYFVSIVEGVSPMIAEWMVKQFVSPPVWLKARTTFTASQAMWSIVGHIVGLGDRHPDNILIDQESGEIVHVDFDCIFSRGMVLTIPELVPFRLTKICVSAMGITGVEGRFRLSCECLMKLMRKKKKTLLTVLHAFIADPLIDWNTSGSSSKKAKEVVGAIEKKLNGYVDVGEMQTLEQSTEKLIIYNENNSDGGKTSGLGKDRGAPLSVEGQVDELIRAAVCQRNLSKMYLGWMPLF